MNSLINLKSTLAALVILTASGVVAAEPTKPKVDQLAKITEFDSATKSVCEGLPGCDFVLLSGDPKTGPTQWFFRLKAGTAFPRHWHSTPENMVTVHGALTFNFETGQKHTLRAGEHLSYQAGMIHGGKCEPGEDCLFYVFNDLPYDFNLAD